MIPNARPATTPAAFRLWLRSGSDSVACYCIGSAGALSEQGAEAKPARVMAAEARRAYEAGEVLLVQAVEEAPGERGRRFHYLAIATHALRRRWAREA